MTDKSPKTRSSTPSFWSSCTRHRNPAAAVHVTVVPFDDYRVGGRLGGGQLRCGHIRAGSV
jgi:hypothetical protein